MDITIKVTKGLKEEFYRVDENQWDLICALGEKGCFAEDVKIEKINIVTFC